MDTKLRLATAERVLAEKEATCAEKLANVRQIEAKIAEIERQRAEVIQESDEKDALRFALLGQDLALLNKALAEARQDAKESAPAERDRRTVDELREMVRQEDASALCDALAGKADELAGLLAGCLTELRAVAQNAGRGQLRNVWRPKPELATIIKTEYPI